MNREGLIWGMASTVRFVHMGVADLSRCFPVMVQLRSDLTAEQFEQQVARQFEQGYKLLAAEEEGKIVGLAGYRIGENLAWGRFLYVDDIVTDEAARSTGVGTRLISWLKREALKNGCSQLHLDSGVHRFGAHRFYLRQGLDITSHHFGIKLDRKERGGRR